LSVGILPPVSRERPLAGSRSRGLIPSRRWGASRKISILGTWQRQITQDWRLNPMGNRQCHFRLLYDKGAADFANPQRQAKCHFAPFCLSGSGLAPRDSLRGEVPLRLSRGKRSGGRERSSWTTFRLPRARYLLIADRKGRENYKK
jgi:hypothetical protein